MLAVLGAVNKPPNLIVLSLYMPYGSLYDVLHVSGGANNVVVDANQALRFAYDIANGMDFLHSPDLKVASFNLNSKHVMVGFVSYLKLASLMIIFRAALISVVGGHEHNTICVSN